MNKIVELRNSFRKYFSEYSHLFIISGSIFLLIYLSSFTKGYGYFIDEFYYIACALNPAFGYVDHPPFAPLVLTLFQFIFGTSLYVIRFLPALAVATSVFLTGILAKEIGGGKFAQLLAACSMAAAPMVIAFGGFYSMNAFELLLAILLLYYTIRMIKENNYKRWIIIGVIMGLGLMNKHTFALFILLLIFSLIVAGKWKLILNRWFLFGGLCGFIVFLPNILWQVFNHYPSLEFYRNISVDKNVYTPPAAFIMGQVIGMSPAVVPIWVAGIFFFLFSKRMKDFKFLSVLFLGLFTFMLISGTSRSDRMIFAYPAVLTGGAMFFENVIEKFNLRWFKGVILVLLVSGLAISLPIILPYFSYSTVMSHTKLLGINTEIEKGKKPPLPQLLADRIGWEEKVDLVNQAYHKLTDEEKKETVIASGNYGQAGAIELYGKKYHFPLSVCSHNNYYLWTKERIHGSIVLYLTEKENFHRLQELFGEVEPCEGEFYSPYVSSHENHLKVFICKKPRISYEEMLERGKNYH